MKIINENLKKAGYVNTVLILIAIVLRIIGIFKAPALVVIDSIICIAALVFGLIYALNGYKKGVAKYYKIFMYLLVLSSLLALSTLTVEFDVLTFICDIIVLACVLILALTKDLGEYKSNCCSILILSANLVKCFYTFLKTTDIVLTSAGFANLVLACILCVFVSAKYTDKESRGSK